MNGIVKKKVRTASTSSIGSSEDDNPNSPKPSDDTLPKKVQLKGFIKKVSVGEKTDKDKPKSVSKSKDAPTLSLAGIIAAKAIAKTVRPATAGAKPSGNLMSAVIMAKRKPIKPKMDLAKALSIMGFGTARTLDPSGSKNARMELNASLQRKMNDFDQKKRKLLEMDKGKSFISESARIQLKDKFRDDIRTLHEAYQFLARKYIRDEEKLAEKLNSNASANETDEIALDLTDDLHFVNNWEDEDENEDDNNEVFNNKKSSAYVDNLKIKIDRKKTT